MLHLYAHVALLMMVLVQLVDVVFDGLEPEMTCLFWCFMININMNNIIIIMVTFMIHRSFRAICSTSSIMLIDARA